MQRIGKGSIDLAFLQDRQQRFLIVEGLSLDGREEGSKHRLVHGALDDADGMASRGRQPSFSLGGAHVADEAGRQREMKGGRRGTRGAARA